MSIKIEKDMLTLFYITGLKDKKIRTQSVHILFLISEVLLRLCKGFSSC